MKTPSVSTSSFNKTKMKDIQSTDTAWKMSITNKAPFYAGREARAGEDGLSSPAREANCQ